MSSQLDNTSHQPPEQSANPGAERGSSATTSVTRELLRRAERARRRLAGIHSDERGTISILTVFTLLMFTMLLIMIVNVATHVDDKLRMQNAADAAAYSGGLVLSRGMNSVAFSNHLLCDVFAITAYLREGRDRNAEQLTPEILDAWERNGELFSRAEYEKFSDLSSAIDTQIAQERALIATFGEMTQVSSDFALSVFEYVLQGDSDPGNPDATSGGGLIPAFQRTVIESTPTLAQHATNEIAYRHGLTNQQLNNLSSSPPAASSERGHQRGVLWRTSVEPLFQTNEFDPLTRTLPIVDPDPAQSDYAAVPNPEQYFSAAVEQRRQLAKYYLEQWNRDKLQLFDREGQMSQFSNIWRILTCAALEELLNEEYPETNLPMQMRFVDGQQGLEEILRGLELQTGLSRRREADRSELMTQLQQRFDVRTYLEADFHFVATVYRRHPRETGPGLFHNPLEPHADALTFAQVQLYIPFPRRFLTYAGHGSPTQRIGLGGSFGFDGGIDLPQPPPQPGDQSPELERWPRENWPTYWDMLNQNWTVRLVPATVVTLPDILQTNPGGNFAEFRPPNLGNATISDIKKISTH